jgi:hypothetical protein
LALKKLRPLRYKRKVDVKPKVEVKEPPKPIAEVPKVEPVKETKVERIKDEAEIQRIKNSIDEGELILKTGKIHGRKLSPEELKTVQKSVDNAKAKIGLIETPKEVPTAESKRVVPIEVEQAYLDRAQSEFTLNALKKQKTVGKKTNDEIAKTQSRYDNADRIIKEFESKKEIQKQKIEEKPVNKQIKESPDVDVQGDYPNRLIKAISEEVKNGDTINGLKQEYNKILNEKGETRANSFLEEILQSQPKYKGQPSYKIKEQLGSETKVETPKVEKPIEVKPEVTLKEKKVINKVIEKTVDTQDKITPILTKQKEFLHKEVDKIINDIVKDNNLDPKTLDVEWLVKNTDFKTTNKYTIKIPDDGEVTFNGASLSQMVELRKRINRLTRKESTKRKEETWSRDDKEMLAKGNVDKYGSIESINDAIKMNKENLATAKGNKSLEKTFSDEIIKLEKIKRDAEDYGFARKEDVAYLKTIKDDNFDLGGKDWELVDKLAREKSKGVKPEDVIKSLEGYDSDIALKEISIYKNKDIQRFFRGENDSPKSTVKAKQTTPVVKETSTLKPEVPKGSNAIKVEFESGKKAELLLKDFDTLKGVKDPIKNIDYGKVEFTKDGKVKWDSFKEVTDTKTVTKESPIDVRVKAKKSEKLGYASVGDVKPLSQRAEGSVEQFRVSERAKNILRELDIPINEKLIPRRLLGFYKYATDAVRVQSLNDVTTVVHEATHAISRRSKLGEDVWKDRRTVKELTDIYEEYYPGAKRTHKKDKRVEEGIAVLLENYFYNPTEVITKFPTLVDKFIKSDGKYHRKEFEFLLDKMGELAGDYAKMTPEQRIASRLRSGEEVVKSQNSGFTFGQRLVYNLFNRFEPLNRVAKIGGVKETWKDPTVSAFNWMNRNSHIANWVEGDRATILQRDGNIKYSDATMKKVTKLIQGKEKEFDAFLIARRVVENHNEMVRLKNNDMLTEANNLAEIMRKDDISLQDAQAVLSKYQKDFSLPIKIYDKINKNLIDFAENTGLIAPDIANTFRETKGYASFKRFVNDELGNEFIGTVSTNPKTKVSSFKARTGSNLDIISPLYNQMTSISEIISKGYENMIWRKVYDLSLKNKEIARRFEEIQTTTAVDGQGRISFPQDRNPSLIKVMVDGKRKYIKPTPDFIEVAKNLRGAEWDAFTTVLRLPASIFTRLTTSANPMFAFGNATIDQISMGMQTKTKAIPIIDPVKNLPNFLKEMVGKDSMLKDYLDAGGKRQTVADFYRIAPEDAVKKLSGNLSKGEKLGNVIDKGISVLELPSNYSEYMSRFSEFKRSVESGEPTSVALYRASEVTTPFQLYGNWGGKGGSIIY